MQPGSNESPGYSEPKEQTLNRLNRLKDSIVKYNPCAKILLYEISYGVWGNTQSDLNTYNNTMSLIRSNCEYWADNAHIFFAPAGEAMRTAWNNDTSTMLWGSTGNVHPNARGSYIIACSFYASIFQKNSFGTTINGPLTQVEAETYQQMVDNLVLNNLSDWRINTFNQYTDFNYNVDVLEVTFNSTSQNIDSLLWNFGDGNTSTSSNIVHTYSQSGTYTVTLTTFKGNCEETVTKTITTNTVGIDDINQDSIFSIYPNPFTNKLSIKLKKEINIDNISIYNIIGQNLTHLITIDKEQEKINIDAKELPKGIYILNIGSFTRKIIKKN